MRLLTVAILSTAIMGLTGCSSDLTSIKKEAVRAVAAGDKAGVGHLTYNVIDSQVLAQLGEDANPRVPHDRFLVVQIAVTNSSNVDNPIPAVELVGDSGQTYNEVADGTGVPNWLGVVRHVGPGQTERGAVAFDAPAAHYRLRFTDETMNSEILADLPLSYAHEQLHDAMVPTTELPNVTAPTGSQKTKTK